MLRFRFFSTKPPGIIARLSRLNAFYDSKECELLVGDVSLLADMGTIKRQDAMEILMELSTNLALRQEIIPLSMWTTMIQIIEWNDIGKIKSVRSKFSNDVIRKNRKVLLQCVQQLLQNSPRNYNRLVLVLLDYSGPEDEEIISEILNLPWKKSLQVWDQLLAKYYSSETQTIEMTSSILYQMSIVDGIDCSARRDERDFKAYGITLKFNNLKAQFNALVPEIHVYGDEFYDSLILSLISSKNYNCVYSTVLHLLHTPELRSPSSFVFGHAIRQLYHSGHQHLATDLVIKGVDADLYLSQTQDKLRSNYDTLPRKMALNLHLLYQIVDGIFSVKDLSYIGRRVVEKASIYGFDQVTVQDYFSRGDIYLSTWEAGIEAGKKVSTYLRSSSQDHTFMVIRKLAQDNNFELAVKVADEVIERQKGNASSIFFAMLVSSNVLPRKFQTLELMVSNLLKNGQAIYPDIFNAWIKKYLINGDFKKARETFYNMQKIVAPDLYTYLSFVSFEFRRKRADLAHLWFEECVQKGIPATTVGLSILATGYLKAGNLDKALEYYGTMIGYNFKNGTSMPVQDSQLVDTKSTNFFTLNLWIHERYEILCLVISKTALTSRFQKNYLTWLMVATNLLNRNYFCAIALTGTCNDIPTMNLAIKSVGRTVLFDKNLVSKLLECLREASRRKLSKGEDESIALKYYKLCFTLISDKSLMNSVFGVVHSFRIEQYLKLLLLEMMRGIKNLPSFSFAESPGFKLLTSEIPGNLRTDAYVETLLKNLPDKKELSKLNFCMDSYSLSNDGLRNVVKLPLMNERLGETIPMVIRPTNFSSQIYYIFKNNGKKAAEKFFEAESVNRAVDLAVLSNVVRHQLKPKSLENIPNILQYIKAKGLNATPSFLALLYQSNYDEETGREMIFTILKERFGEKEAYIFILYAFCKAGSMVLADLHLQHFLQKGYDPPDDHFYFHFMTGFLKIGQIENSLYFLERIIGYDLNSFSRLPNNPLPENGIVDSDKYHSNFKNSFIKSVISKTKFPIPSDRIDKIVHFLTLHAKVDRHLSVDLAPKIASFSLDNHSCWGLYLLYMNSVSAKFILKDACILLSTKSRNFVYHQDLIDTVFKVIKSKVGDSPTSAKSVAEICFEILFSFDDNPSKLYLELILYTAICFDFEVESSLEHILREESALKYLQVIKNSGLFAKEKFNVTKIPKPTTFTSILDETLPFAAPLVNLFQPHLFPQFLQNEGHLQKPFKERYAEALLAGDDKVDFNTLLREYPDLATQLNKHRPSK